jgi:hypothetical protein
MFSLEATMFGKRISVGTTECKGTPVRHVCTLLERCYVVRFVTMMVVSAGFFTGAAVAAEPAVASLAPQASHRDARFSEGFDEVNAGLAATTRTVRCGDGSVDDDICTLLGNRRMDVRDRSEALAVRLEALGGTADGWMVPVIQPVVRCVAETVPALDRDGDMIGFERTGRQDCRTVGATVATFWVSSEGAVMYRGVRHVSGDPRLVVADVPMLASR